MGYFYSSCSLIVTSFVMYQFFMSPHRSCGPFLHHFSLPKVTRLPKQNKQLGNLENVAFISNHLLGYKKVIQCTQRYGICLLLYPTDVKDK